MGRKSYQKWLEAGGVSDLKKKGVRSEEFWREAEKRRKDRKLALEERRQLEKADRYREKLERKIYIVALVEKRREVEDKTLQEIGDELGITQERVRQIYQELRPKPKQPRGEERAAHITPQE